MNLNFIVMDIKVDYVVSTIAVNIHVREKEVVCGYQEYLYNK